MAKFFEKSINLGLGLFSYSKEKIEDVVEDLVNKGEVAKQDARQFTNELIKRGEEQRIEIQKMIKNEVDETMNHMNIPNKEDVVHRDEISEIVRKEVIQVLKEEGIQLNEADK